MEPRLNPTLIERIIGGVAACMFVLLLAAANQARADDWFGPDKALHFGISLGISAGSYGAASLFVDSRVGRLAIGGAVGVGTGAGKELYDLWSDGDPSWRDFTWDLLGVATGLGLAWLIDELIGGRDRAPAASDSDRGRGLPATTSSERRARRSQKELYALVNVGEQRTVRTLSSSSWSATPTSP